MASPSNMPTSNLPSLNYAHLKDAKDVPQTTSPPANAFVRTMRKAYQPLGFKKGYNFTFFFIFSGAMLGFCLARLPYLDFERVMCGPGFSALNRAMPGECFWYRNSQFEKVGILMHLATVLPAGILVWVQFVPAIRYRWIRVHRVNGYLMLLLALLGTIGGLMITRHSFGGAVVIQTATGLAGLAFVTSLVLAWVNIKFRMRIDQHRAWMLRAWFYAGAIVTMRPLGIITTQILGRIGEYHGGIPCKVAASLVSTERFAAVFGSTCAAYLSGQDPEQWVIVPAVFANAPSPASIAVALNQGMMTAGWLALVIHAAGVETYLQLTAGETQRLREVSEQRRIKAGMVKEMPDTIELGRMP